MCLYWEFIWWRWRSEEHTSELQSLRHLVCRLLLVKILESAWSVQSPGRRKEVLDAGCFEGRCLLKISPAVTSQRKRLLRSFAALFFFECSAPRENQHLSPTVASTV